MERTGAETWKPGEVARVLALVESEKRYYQDILAAVPVPLAVLAGDRSIVSTNSALRRMLRLRPEDIQQKTIEQVLPSDELIEYIRSAHVRGETPPILLNIGGLPLRITAVPTRPPEAGGEPETLLAIEDLSGVKTKASSESRATGEIPAIVWRADAGTLAFQHVDGAARQILGYPASHWLNAPQFFSERINAEDRGGVIGLYKQVLASGGQASAEYRAVSASGEAVWCRETISVAPPSGPGKRMVTGVLMRAGAERQLERQLQTAGRIEALRLLCGKLAHDLNNPLMAVTGYAEEMRNALPAGDPLRNDLEQILTAAAQINDLSGLLLGFNDPPTEPPVQIAAGTLVSAMEPRLREIAAVEVSAVSVNAIGVAAQLQDAILALAAAALEQTGKPSRLKISCEPVAIAEYLPNATLSPGVYACIRIQAAGRNVVQTDQNPFESFLPAKSGKSGGPALANAYSNVRAWGGDIWFSIDSQEGAIFQIYLPGRASSPSPSREPGRIGPITILVVEDEPGIRSLILKILRREGHQVLEATSAEEAISISSAARSRIDLLLTDVMLPRMTGRELAENLMRSRPEMRIVYISGFTGDEAARLNFRPGAMFLQKPFTLDSLMAKIREAVER